MVQGAAEVNGQALFEATYKKLFSEGSSPHLEPGTMGSAHANVEQKRAGGEWLRSRREKYAWRAATSEEASYSRESVAGHEGSEIFVRPLPFWRGGQLWHFGPADDPEQAARSRRAPRYVSVPSSMVDRYALKQAEEAQWQSGTLGISWGSQIAIPLNGQSSVIHAVDAAYGRVISDVEAMLEWLAFFCEHVHGDAGPFSIIEHDAATAPPYLVPAARDIRPGPELGAWRAEQERKLQPSRHLPEEYTKMQLAHPMYVIDPPLNVQKDHEADEAASWVLATLVYSDTPFRTLFRVPSKGVIEMVEDEPLSSANLQVSVAGWGGPLEAP